MKKIDVVRALPSDSDLIARIGKETFWDSHKDSAPQHELTFYVDQTYNPEVVHKDLEDKNNIYHIIYKDKVPAGYSKITLNTEHPKMPNQNLTKLHRLYLLKEVYGTGLAQSLLKFNVELSQTHQQAGMWLMVWIGNYRAIKFYEKSGFKMIGDTQFKLSETRSNPNYWMYLNLP